MGKDAFFKLFDIIAPFMPGTGERVGGGVPNGPITKVSRLAMALRYCAGGDPADIADHHGVEVGEVNNSVWDVVDAIHNAPELEIKFPETATEQQDLADGFKTKSEIGIPMCVGAIDGILIWIHMPSATDVEGIKFGPSKFFCGRKKKYGVNMQGVCDADRRFLAVEIKFPGSTSDFFAFEQSNLRKMLEEGLLKNGFCLFGDNAYTNAPYMVVPFSNVRGGAKDAFNFFQSQLRINIECAFGMLVHRFGILRKAIPMNIEVSKTNSLVLALCKLHNFCIDHSDGMIERSYYKDATNIIRDGGMFSSRFDGDSDDQWEYDTVNDRLDDLLDGGQHTQDHSRGDRRRHRRTPNLPNQVILDNHVRPLPNQIILDRVFDRSYQRPARSRLRRNSM